MFITGVFAIAVMTLQVALSLPPDYSLDLPDICDNGLICLVPICFYKRCTKFPYAQCRGYCNGCVARFFIRDIHITPLCDDQQDD